MVAPYRTLRTSCVSFDPWSPSPIFVDHWGGRVYVYQASRHFRVLSAHHGNFIILITIVIFICHPTIAFGIFCLGSL